MKKIRSARRLLEKVFPQMENSLHFDRVLVLNNTHNPLSKKKGDWEAPLPNLFLAADWAIPGGASLTALAETIFSIGQ